MFHVSIGRLSQCIFGHLDVVTCLAYSDDNATGSTAIIVSGSRDATVLVWLWDHKKHRVVVPNVPSCKFFFSKEILDRFCQRYDSSTLSKSTLTSCLLDFRIIFYTVL